MYAKIAHIAFTQAVKVFTNKKTITTAAKTVYSVAKKLR